MNLRSLKTVLGVPKGVVLDVVVPSYRTNNNDFLERIAMLRATRQMYVRFWFVVDNPRQDHVTAVKQLASGLNAKQLKVDVNYFVNVVHYMKIAEPAMPETQASTTLRQIGSYFSTMMSFPTKTSWTPILALFVAIPTQKSLLARRNFRPPSTRGQPCCRRVTWATSTGSPSK